MMPWVLLVRWDSTEAACLELNTTLKLAEAINVAQAVLCGQGWDAHTS